MALVSNRRKAALNEGLVWDQVAMAALQALDGILLLLTQADGRPMAWAELLRAVGAGANCLWSADAVAMLSLKSRLLARVPFAGPITRIGI
jgi:hypothetical protein